MAWGREAPWLQPTLGFQESKREPDCLLGSMSQDRNCRALWALFTCNHPAPLSPPEEVGGRRGLRGLAPRLWVQQATSCFFLASRIQKHTPPPPRLHLLVLQQRGEGSWRNPNPGLRLCGPPWGRADEARLCSRSLGSNANPTEPVSLAALVGL